MRILALNCGSSSVKFGVLDVEGSQVHARVTGDVTGIGGASTLDLREGGKSVCLLECQMSNHTQAVQWALECLEARNIKGEGSNLLASVEAVGHRIVHGGDRFQSPVRIDDGVLKQIEALSPLAPMHNPACVAGIKA